MAYQKLQPLGAIEWVPTDDVSIPNPGGKVFEDTSDAATLQDHLLFTAPAGTNGFVGVVNLGATVQNVTTNEFAKVLHVGKDALKLNYDIFQANSQNFKVYNVDSSGALIYVGAGGAGTILEVKTASGNIVPFVDPQTGQTVQILVDEIRSGTTAGKLVALW